MRGLLHPAAAAKKLCATLLTNDSARLCCMSGAVYVYSNPQSRCSWSVHIDDIVRSTATVADGPWLTPRQMPPLKLAYRHRIELAYLSPADFVHRVDKTSYQQKSDCTPAAAAEATPARELTCLEAAAPHDGRPYMHIKHNLTAIHCGAVFGRWS